MRVETELVLNQSRPFSTPARLTDLADPSQDVAVIRLSGPLAREARAQFFMEQVQDLVSRGQLNLLIDLAEVPYIDSMGLGALASVYNTTRDARGHIRFLSPSRSVLQSLRRVHLDHVFEFFASEAEALATL